jgi:hypothetical protein
MHAATKPCVRALSLLSVLGCLSSLAPPLPSLALRSLSWYRSRACSLSPALSRAFLPSFPPSLPFCLPFPLPLPLSVRLLLSIPLPFPHVFSFRSFSSSGSRSLSLSLVLSRALSLARLQKIVLLFLFQRMISTQLTCPLAPPQLIDTFGKTPHHELLNGGPGKHNFF